MRQGVTSTGKGTYGERVSGNRPALTPSLSPCYTRPDLLPLQQLVTGGISLPSRRARLLPHQAALSRLLLATALVLGLLLPLLPAPAAAQGAARPRYEIAAQVDLDAATVSAQETVTYTNQTGDPLDSIVFHVTAAYYDAFTLSRAKVDDQAVKPSLDGIVLEVPLPRTLAPGESTM